MEKHTNSELENKLAVQAMKWYGWGSPIGLGFFLVSASVFICLLRLAKIF